MNRRQSLTACALAALCAACAPTASRSASGAFDRTLERDGVRFRVRSDNSGSLNPVRIDIQGRLGSHTHVEERAGLVVDAAVGDLDADGVPELYVMTASVGSGSYGEVLGLTIALTGRLQSIALADDAESPALLGYQGHDRFELRERTLLRRFPVYRPGDPNTRPSGGARVLRYGLPPPRPGTARSLALEGHADATAAP